MTNFEQLTFDGIKEKNDWKTELKIQYKDRMNTAGSILDMLNRCKRVYDVSYEVGWGIGYDDLLDLCAGYIFGNKTLKTKITDFLEDCNFHTENAKIQDDAERFYLEATDHNSEYYRNFWFTLIAK